MKYLISSVETYRVDTEGEATQLINDSKAANEYTLSKYNCERKDIKEKGESRRPSAITLSVIGVCLILVPFGIWREGDPAHIRSSKVFMAVTLDE